MMKKTLLLYLLVAVASIAYADYTAPGYYRIKNYKTKRYASVIDDKGKINFANATADLQAIKLQKNFDEVCCDPASILYIKDEGGHFQIEAQGTGLYQIVNNYVNLMKVEKADGQQLYKAYGEHSGVVKYIGDAEAFPSDLGMMGTNSSGDYQKWYILPVDENSENFFGVRPKLNVSGKHFTSMYASFPYTSVSPDVKSYYISNISSYYGMVALTEITGTVPASTPVIIECSSDAPVDNLLKIGGSSTAINGNIMKGAYFNNSQYDHINRVEYKRDTMRVLGICEDGSLGFIVPESLDYIPANECYITVQPGSPAEFKIVSQEVFEAGVKEIAVETGSNDLYNIQGQLIRRNPSTEDLNSLPAGIYILGGKKFIKK